MGHPLNFTATKICSFFGFCCFLFFVFLFPCIPSPPYTICAVTARILPPVCEDPPEAPLEEHLASTWAVP